MPFLRLSSQQLHRHIHCNTPHPYRDDVNIQPFFNSTTLTYNSNTHLTVTERSIVISLSVCLSVQTDIAEITWPIFANFLIMFPDAMDSVLLCWHRDTLCTSSFVPDVTFSHNGPYSSMPLALQGLLQRQPQVMHTLLDHRLRPLLNDSWCKVCQGLVWCLRLPCCKAITTICSVTQWVYLHGELVSLKNVNFSAERYTQHKCINET